MVARARLCLGKGAHYSILLKFLRPLKVVDKAILNPVKGQRLDDLIAISREVMTRGGKSFISIFLEQHYPRPVPFCQVLGYGVRATDQQCLVG
jgi:hypothetical protein